MMVLVGGITYIFFRNAWILMMFAMFCYDKRENCQNKIVREEINKWVSIEGKQMNDKENTIKIVLLGLDFKSSNFGCSALGFSFFSILEKIAENNKVFLDVVSVNYNEFVASGKYYNVESLRVRYRTPGFYIKYMEALKNADLVFDFTGGDSFTDIYGKSRFNRETLLKQLAIWKKKKLVLGPQTIGPFNSEKIAKKAAKVMQACEKVYVRDKMSQDYATKLGVTTNLTTDVAFVLPIDEQYNVSVDENKVKLGLNISGLMWNGGYTGNNDFGLKLDYKEYCKRLIEYAINQQYDIHLISHVISDDQRENDYAVALELKKMYPEIIVAPRFDNPLQAKAYLSKMDMFIGSRMHATVGAFSRGVPTLSIAYSRKFQGLYSGIGYPHVIDAKAVGTDEALKTTIQWICNKDNVQLDIDKSLELVREKAELFAADIEQMVLSVKTR